MRKKIYVTEIDYNDIGTILKDALAHCSMSQETKFFLNQYLSTLRKYDMMDEPELQDLAQKIYNKHKEALDFIYDNAQNEDALKFKHYHKWLAEKKGLITRQNKASASIQFATEDLYSNVFGDYKKFKIKPEDLIQCCYYEIQKRFMNEIKLVLHNVKDDSLPNEILERLNAARTKLVKKSDPVWQWASAHKYKIGAEHLFDKYDLNDEKLDEELAKSLNSALEKCQSAVLKKL